MYIALNSNNQRILVDEATKGEVYFCPVCGSEVILRDGDIRVAHFAHRANGCVDSWHYDMSEWHRQMQSHFSPCYQEVVVRSEGQVHRADILKDDIVVEFQHSPITAEEFCERNNFYTSLGLRVAWVFDVNEERKNGNLTWYDATGNQNMMKWKYPKQILREGPTPKEKAGNIAVFLAWRGEGKNEDKDSLYRVVWSSKGIHGDPDYKRIIVSEYIEIEKDSSLEEWFLSKWDKLKRYLANYEPYQEMVIGIKGYRRDAYVCPRTEVFGLKIFGEKGCAYCKHCAAIAEEPVGGKVYCCFPREVRAQDNTVAGYECGLTQVF